jgi:ADP-heptose:LPS heptosyltransferase
VHSLDPRPRDGAPRHIVDQWQTQLEAQGLLVPKCVHQQPRQRGLGLPDELRARGRRLLQQMDCPHNAILLHPGSGGHAKCWPLACFVAVARGLRDAARVEVCFLVGPAEMETWPRAVLEPLFQEFPVLACPGPDELVALLAAARAFIGNDAGPSHLAALLGTPTLAIFGPTSSLVWRPLGLAVTVLQGDPVRFPGDWGLRPETLVVRVPRAASL